MNLSERKLSKAYFEITNVCNAKCSFCPQNSRVPRFVSKDEFDIVLEKLSGRVEYLYFHLMGEPLLHRDICDFAVKAKDSGFKVMITTNGILAKEKGIPLVRTGSVFKISISLHSYEANSFSMSLDDYLDGCFSLAEKARENGTICVFRLWNISDASDVEKCLNGEIIDRIKDRFGDDWYENRSGFRIKDHIFLEWGKRFKWPGSAEEKEEVFCHALRSQIGILSDGTAVPCCLDSDGKMALGNIFESSLEEILSCDRAMQLYNGFTEHRSDEPMCRTCGFARRFV